MTTRRNMEFLYALYKADNQTDAVRLFEELIKQFGYTRFVYAHMNTQSTATKNDYIHINTFPDDWMNFYLDNGLFNNDLLLDNARSGITTLWSDMYQNLENGFLPERYHQSLRGAYDFDMCDGVTFPLIANMGFEAGISLVPDKGISTTEIDKSFMVHREELHEAVNIFHSLFELGPIIQAHYKLTSNELDVLKWLAEGEQLPGVAHRLNKSESTVESQKYSAVRRLGAKTTTEAVAKAVRYGLI